MTAASWPDKPLIESGALAAASLLLTSLLTACGGASGLASLPARADEATPIVSETQALHAVDPLDSPSPPTPIEPAVYAGTEDLTERPLETLSEAAKEYVDSREGPVGVAVVVPSQRAIYTYNGDDLFPMASVAKVTIMVTVMERAVQEGRDLTDREGALLEPMIIWSDNTAATALWDGVGGGSAVGAYLASIGLSAIIPNPYEYWGATRAPAREVALLFAKLGFGEILDPSMRTYALDLLSRVSPDQRWGVTAGVPDEQPPGTVVGIKDGWYPTNYGRWWVNSAGVILPGDDHIAYAIAVLTRYQSTMDYAVETIEGVAAQVHTALHGRGPVPSLSP